jgi:glucokinase
VILAGDIGGTRTRIAFFELVRGKPALAVDREYPSREYQGLDEIISQFVRDVAGTIDSACFGVAGPVLNGRVATPNLAWLVDAAAITKLLNNKSVWLINDLEA